jgi:hypothetical protein
MSRHLLPAILLGALSIFVFAGCSKKTCKMCQTYATALKQCDKSTSKEQREAALKSCDSLCKKRETLPIGDRRSKFSRQYMRPYLCIVDFESTGCKGFKRCLSKAK